MITEFIVAINVKFGTITSSPGFKSKIFMQAYNPQVQFEYEVINGLYKDNELYYIILTILN